MKFNSFVMGLYRKEFFHDVPWKCRDSNGNELLNHGFYLLCDGGYHQWGCLISPISIPLDDNQRSFSKRIESVRKDIECFFGRLKKRFRIFATGYRMRDLAKLDDIFRICCAMHNSLLPLPFENDFDLDEVDNPDDDGDLEGHHGHQSIVTNNNGQFPVMTSQLVESGHFTRRGMLVEHYAWFRSQQGQ